MSAPVNSIALLAPYDLLAFIAAAVATGRATPIQEQLRPSFTAALDRADSAAGRARRSLEKTEPKPVSGAESKARRPGRALAQVNMQIKAETDSGDRPFTEALSALAEAGEILARAGMADAAQPLNAMSVWRNRRAGA